MAVGAHLFSRLVKSGLLNRCSLNSPGMRPSFSPFHWSREMNLDDLSTNSANFLLYMQVCSSDSQSRYPRHLSILSSQYRSINYPQTNWDCRMNSVVHYRLTLSSSPLSTCALEAQALPARGTETRKKASPPRKSRPNSVAQEL